jgi:integrase
MAERIKFTDRAIKALPNPAAGDRAEYADTETIGLRLRVSSSGVKTFSLLRRVKNGPMERITLGRWDDIRCEEAQRRAKSLSGLIADGANPAELNRANKGEPTFSVLFAEYLERHARRAKRTWREDEQKYRDYLERPLGGKKISGISRTDLAAIHSSITRAGHPTVANRVKDLVSSVFTRAIEWGHLDANPAKGIKDNPERSRKRFLKAEELPRVFAALESEPNANFRDYFLLCLLTGARRDNVRAMQWRDLDLERGEWIIPHTKNGESQTVPLVSEAVSILAQRQSSASDDHPGFVFPASRADSKHGHMSGERKAWLRLLDRDEVRQLRQRVEAKTGKPDVTDGESTADALQRLRNAAKRLKIRTEGARLEDIRIHDLRRTMGSWQARMGASLLVIGKSLGHKSQQATAVYAHLELDPIRESMSRAASAILVAGGARADAEVTELKAANAKR